MTAPVLGVVVMHVCKQEATVMAQAASTSYLLMRSRHRSRWASYSFQMPNCAPSCFTVTNACVVVFAPQSLRGEDGVFLELWSTIKSIQRVPSKAPLHIVAAAMYEDAPSVSTPFSLDPQPCIQCVVRCGAPDMICDMHRCIEAPPLHTCIMNVATHHDRGPGVKRQKQPHRLLSRLGP